MPAEGCVLCKHACTVFLPFRSSDCIPAWVKFGSVRSRPGTGAGWRVPGEGAVPSSGGPSQQHRVPWVCAGPGSQGKVPCPSPDRGRPRGDLGVVRGES